jgi:hypothetical protein
MLGKPDGYCQVVMTFGEEMLWAPTFGLDKTECYDRAIAWWRPIERDDPPKDRAAWLRRFRKRGWVPVPVWLTRKPPA